jgi:sugar phosphate isomerase/epimerase
MSVNIDRRQCLRLGLGALVGASIAADKPPPRLSFGFSLYGMRALPLDEAMAACAKIGYDAVELAALPGWPADPTKLDRDARKKIRERLGELKLALPALMENLPPEAGDTAHKAQLDRLKAVADLGAELSPAKPCIIETILGGKVDEWEKRRDLFAKRLEDWARVAEAAKTTIAVKPHRFNAMNLPEQALWLIERVKSPAVRLAFDWSHYEQRQLKMKETLHALIPFTCFVHVKDTIVVDGKPTFVLPGEGSTDYTELLAGLKNEGYAGCVCVEVSSAVSGKKDYDPIAAAKKCYEKLSPAFVKT